MSIFKKIAKGIGDVVTDTVKIGLEPIKGSVNSITNKNTIDYDYATKPAKAVGGTVEVGTDSVHKLLQTYSGAITGNYDQKVSDLWRSEDAKKSKGVSYLDSNTTFTSGPLAKFESGSEKGAVIVGSLATTLLKKKEEPAALGTPASGNKGIGGMLQAQQDILKSQTNEPVSLLSKVTTGLNTFSKSPIGQTAIGVLGNVITNLATPKTSQVPSQVPQQLALAGGTMTSAPPSSQTTAQKAVFEGWGVEVTGPGNTKVSSGGDWWTNNKSWALPVAIGAGVLLGIPLLILLFKFIGKLLK